MQQLEQQALAYLNKEPILHIDMIEAIHRGTGRIEDVSEHGVLIKAKEAPIYFLSSYDERTFIRLAQKAEKTDCLLVVHQQEYAEVLQKETKFVAEVYCRHAAYTKKEEIPLPETPFTIKPLTIDYLKQVAEHYSMGLGEEYVRERIEKETMVGAFWEGELAGFAGVHDEGSIGLVEVLPQF